MKAPATIGAAVSALEMARRLRELAGDKAVFRVVVNASKRVLHRARNAAGDLFRSRGIGRRIWGKAKKTDVRSVIKRLRVQKSGTTITLGLEARGLAAIQELGGRTKAHVIKARAGKRLRVVDRQGVARYPSRVNHPGSRVPSLPFLQPSLARHAHEFMPETEKAMLDAWDKVVEKGGKA